MSKEYFIYRLLSLKGLGNVKVNAILDKLKTEYGSIPQFLDHHLSVATLSRYISVDQVEEFYKANNHLNKAIDEALGIGVKFIDIDSYLYPSRLVSDLKKSAPPILSVRGNIELLNESSVGFCGSRKASVTGMEVATDCAEQLAKKNIVTISGYAAGIDQTAHFATLNANGKTIIVLPEGILNFKIRPNLKPILNWENTLVISQFSLDAPWSVSNAMERNKLIVSLSQIMILIESKENGGSMDAGKTALKLQHKLYAPIYQGMPDSAIGNQILINEGASPIKKSRKTNKANLKNLFYDLEENQNYKKAAHQPQITSIYNFVSS